MIVFYFNAVEAGFNFEVLPKSHINSAQWNKECNILIKFLKLMLKLLIYSQNNCGEVQIQKGKNYIWISLNIYR